VLATRLHKALAILLSASVVSAAVVLVPVATPSCGPASDAPAACCCAPATATEKSSACSSCECSIGVPAPSDPGVVPAAASPIAPRECGALLASRVLETPPAAIAGPRYLDIGVSPPGAKSSLCTLLSLLQI
jgi:hypothetical protein